VFDKNNYKEYSPDWNQKAFRVQFEDVILHDRVRKNIANYEYNRYKNSPLSHIQQNKDLSLAGSILAESPIEVQEDTDTSLEKAMESGEPVFTASEQKVYDEILRRGGTEEDALRTIEKYRGAK
jgi:hypothetical protein